jgi:hypothetical protein
MDVNVQGDPIAELDDRFTRGVAKTAVHVRRYLSFYAGGLGFAVAMLMVPVVHDGGGGTPASFAGSGGAAGAAGSARPAVAAPGGRSATPAGAATAGSSSLGSFASAGDDEPAGGGVVDGAAGAAGAGSGATVGDRRGAPLASPPAVPPTPETPDFGDDAPSAPELCRLEPPSPAPVVSPEREISGAQDTVEAAAGQPLPADAAETVSPVVQQGLCSAPAAPVDAPSVPVPATPVSDSGPRSPLQRLVDLLF